MSKDTTLYLIRHAQSHPRRTTDDADWPLSTRGREQALALTSALADLGIQRIYCSPYLRCRETIRPFVEATSVPVALRHDLRERHICDGWIADFQEVWERSWRDFEFSLPGCESSAACQSRVVAEIDRIVAAEPGGTIGISSHGNAISLFLNHIDPDYGRDEAERLLNPDLVAVKAVDGVTFRVEPFELPRSFTDIQTGFWDTPID